MVTSALGLLQTKPGTALGGRSRAQLPANSVPSNLNNDQQRRQQQLQQQKQKKQQPQQQQPPPCADLLEINRDRSIISQVHLSHTASDVSSIPDYDIFSHTTSEVLRSKKAKEAYARQEAATKVSARSMESDLFAGLDDEQLERMIQKEGCDNKAGRHKSVKGTDDNNPTMLSNVTPKIFTSDAANNYYNAIKREGSMISKTTVTNARSASKAAGKAETAAAKAESKAEAKAAKKVEKAANKKSSKKLLLGGGGGGGSKTKKCKKKKQERNKTLDQLVDEALAVAKTPEEVAQYLIAQEKDGGDIDKKTLYAAIITKLMEQHRKSAAGDANGNGNSKRRQGTAMAGAASPRTIPPVTSFEHSISGIASTTSSITQNSGGFTAPAVPAIEEERLGGEEEEEKEVAAKQGCDGTAPSGFSDEYDPPIVEYPSPVSSPKEIDLGYPTARTEGDEEYDDGKVKSMPTKLKLGTTDARSDRAEEEEACDKTKGSNASRNPSLSDDPAARVGEERSPPRNDRRVGFVGRSAAAEAAEDGPSSPEIARERDASVVNESIEHDLRSYNDAVAAATRANERERVAPSPAESDGTKRSGIGHALIVNELLGHSGSFSLAGGVSISPVSDISNGKNENAPKTRNSSRVLRGVRSMSPSLFYSNVSQEQRAASDDRSKKTGGLKKSEKFGNVPKVDDAQSSTGSSAVESNDTTNSKKIGRVRSMSPLLFKKKRSVDSQPPDGERQQPKATSFESTKDTIASPSPKSSRHTLRAVRSMSPSLFAKREKTIPEEEDPAAADGGSRNGNSKSKDDSTAASTAASTDASSADSLPAESALVLSCAALAAGASSPARGPPEDTEAAATGSAAILSSRAVATGADTKGVADPADERPIDDASEASKGVGAASPDGVRAMSSVGMAGKIKRFASTTNKDVSMSPDTPVIANTSKKANHREDARECIGPAASKSLGCASRESFRGPRSALSSTTGSRPKMRNGGAAPLPPRIPSRSPAPEDGATNGLAPADARQGPPRQGQEAQTVATSSCDDGSVECSVMSSTSDEEAGDNSMLQLTADGNVAVTRLDAADGDQVVPTLIENGTKGPLGGAAAIIASKPSADGSVEVSIMVENGEGRTTPRGTEVSGIAGRLSPLPVPQKERKAKKEEKKKKKEKKQNKEEQEMKEGQEKNDKDEGNDVEEKDVEKKERKKGKLAAAKEKYRKHQPKSPTTQEEKVEDEKGSLDTSVAMPSLEADDTTVVSSESRRSKKEQLGKIKEYRKVAKGNGKKIVEISGANDDDDCSKKKDEMKKAQKKEGPSLSSRSSSSSSKGNSVVESTKKRLALLHSHQKDNSERSEKEQLRQLEPMVSPGTEVTKTYLECTMAEVNGSLSLGSKSMKTKTSKTEILSIKTEMNSANTSNAEKEKWTKDLSGKSIKTARQSDENQLQRLTKLEEQQQMPNSSVQMIPLVHSNSSLGVDDHPVKLVKFDSNYKPTNDDAELDVSLPPEIKDGKKIKIWDEDTSFTDEIRKENGKGNDRTRVSSRGSRRGLFAENCYSCHSTDNNDGVTAAGLDTIDDVNSLFEKTPEGEDAAREAHINDQRRASTGSVFACGILPEPSQLKIDVARDVKGAVHDIKGGIRSSMRNLFGVFDITKEGGVDFLVDNMKNANDQLFGRKPIPKSSPGRASPSAKTTNPHVEKMTSILQGETRTKKTTVQSIDERRKKQAINEQQKQRRYLEKLKEVSMKHL